MSTSAILCFGEALWDLLPDGAVLGGAPLNLAYRLESQGRKAFIVSALGGDDFGRRARRQILDYGMDERFLFQNPSMATGTVEIRLDDKKEPSYTIVRNAAYDAIPQTEELMKAATEAECLCFGTLAQRDVRSRETLRSLLTARRERLNLLDINLRPNCFDRESISYSLKQANILKINDEEAGQLKAWFDFREQDVRELSAAFCRRFNLELCILTLGPKGACVGGPDGPLCTEPSYDVPRVDPCGAGDAFTAAFLTAYLAGMPVDAACRRGNALGSAVTAYRGALQPIPEGLAEELEHSGEPYRFTESDFAVQLRRE